MKRADPLYKLAAVFAALAVVIAAFSAAIPGSYSNISSKMPKLRSVLEE